ncbi:MAG TPA: hypothetical protein VFS20_14405 [Longimicrobium sp.]|nr:hypothetical protein [Longimicrobium sp.]
MIMVHTTDVDTPVVIDIDDTADVVEVPAALAAQIREIAPPDAVAAVLEIVALLIARLGRSTAVPVVETWIAFTPAVLLNFPPDLREELVSGRIGDLRRLSRH